MPAIGLLVDPGWTGTAGNYTQPASTLDTPTDAFFQSATSEIHKIFLPRGIITYVGKKHTWVSGVSTNAVTSTTFRIKWKYPISYYYSLPVTTGTVGNPTGGGNATLNAENKIIDITFYPNSGAGQNVLGASSDILIEIRKLTARNDGTTPLMNANGTINTASYYYIGARISCKAAGKYGISSIHTSNQAPNSALKISAP